MDNYVRWTLTDLLTNTEVFPGSHLSAEIMFGLFGETGEVLESIDEYRAFLMSSYEATGMSDISTRRVYYRLEILKECSDVLVYLTMYVKHYGCSFGLPEDALVTPPGLIATAERALCKSVSKLAEYEKKVLRGTEPPSNHIRTALVGPIFLSLTSVADQFDLDLERGIQEVTADNTLRYERGDFRGTAEVSLKGARE